MLFFNNFSVKVISFPFSDEQMILSGLLSYVITVLWIVGITNAMNLIDGMDGLAGGIGLFALISFLIIGINSLRIN